MLKLRVMFCPVAGAGESSRRGALILCLAKAYLLYHSETVISRQNPPRSVSNPKNITQLLFIFDKGMEVLGACGAAKLEFLPAKPEKTLSFFYVITTRKHAGSSDPEAVFPVLRFLWFPIPHKTASSNSTTPQQAAATVTMLPFFQAIRVPTRRAATPAVS